MRLPYIKLKIVKRHRNTWDWCGSNFGLARRPWHYAYTVQAPHPFFPKLRNETYSFNVSKKGKTCIKNRWKIWDFFFKSKSIESLIKETLLLFKKKSSDSLNSLTKNNIKTLLFILKWWILWLRDTYSYRSLTLGCCNRK